jgi:hypothetical protein
MSEHDANADGIADVLPLPAECKPLPPLHGAPLASRRHLLAVPVPTVEGLLLVARDEDPAFTEDDVLNLARVGQEAAPLLSAALDTRALARALAELSDVSESTDPSDFPGGSAPDRPLTAPE